MELSLLALTACLMYGQFTDAAVPVITGGNTKTATLDENVAAGATAITLTSGTAALYTLTGTDSAAFTSSPATGTLGTTGTITLDGVPDFQTQATYSFNVVVTDATPEVTTVVVTLTIINKSPTFPTAGYSATLCDGAGAGTTVETVTAPAVTTGVTVAYSFITGNTASVFTIVSGTGVITIATGKTVTASTLAGYTLVVHAIDTGTPAQTGTATVHVAISTTCSGAEIITGSVAAILSMLFCFVQKLA